MKRRKSDRGKIYGQKEKMVSTVLLLAGLCGLIPPWKDGRIHNLGNVGLGGALHAAVAPTATKIIDTVAYGGYNVRERLHTTPDTVDLGCGVGFSTAAGGIGVDVSYSMLSVARWLHPNATYARGLAERWGTTDMCSRVTCSFIMHEQPRWRRARIMENALRLSRDEVAIMDIHPSYNPSPMMRSGEPYIDEYLRSIESDVALIVEVHDLDFTSEPLCNGRVMLWTLRR